MEVQTFRSRLSVASSSVVLYSAPNPGLALLRQIIMCNDSYGAGYTLQHRDAANQHKGYIGYNELVLADGTTDHNEMFVPLVDGDDLYATIYSTSGINFTGTVLLESSEYEHFTAYKRPSSSWLDLLTSNTGQVKLVRYIRVGNGYTTVEMGHDIAVTDSSNNLKLMFDHSWFARREFKTFHPNLIIANGDKLRVRSWSGTNVMFVTAWGAIIEEPET